MIFENCAPFTDCTSTINNTEKDHTKDIGVIMPMYNLIEYNDNYSKSSGNLWQYNRDEPVLNINGVIVDFPDDNDSVLFKFKQKITGQTGNDGTKDVQITVPL